MNFMVPYSLLFVLFIHTACILGAQSRALNVVEDAGELSPDMSVSFVPPVSSNPNAPSSPPAGTPVIYPFPFGGSGGLAPPTGYPSSRGFGTPGIYGTPVFYAPPPTSVGGPDGNFGYFPQGGSFGYLPQASPGVYIPPSILRVPSGYSSLGTSSGTYSSSTGSAAAPPNYAPFLMPGSSQRYGVAAVPLYSQVTRRDIARSA